MRSVTYLNLSSNQLFTSEFDIGPFPAVLQVLDLANNNLQGTLPRVLTGPANQLANLTVLDVANNQLQGPLPVQLPSALSVFNASNNRLSGSLPDGWKSLGKMAVLRLDHNPLTG